MYLLLRVNDYACCHEVLAVSGYTKASSRALSVCFSLALHMVAVQLEASRLLGVVTCTLARPFLGPFGPVERLSDCWDGQAQPSYQIALLLSYFPLGWYVSQNGLSIVGRAMICR